MQKIKDVSYQASEALGRTRERSVEESRHSAHEAGLLFRGPYAKPPAHKKKAVIKLLRGLYCYLDQQHPERERERERERDNKR